MAVAPVGGGGAGVYVPGRAAPLWSPASRAGDVVFCAGTVGVRPDGELAGDTVQEQTRQALENLETTLAAADLGFADVAKIRYFIESPEDYERLNEVRNPFYDEVFPAGDFPASTVLVSGLVDPALRVEIEAFAHPRKRVYDTEAIVKRIPLPLADQPRWRLGAETGDLLFTTGQPGLDLEARLVGADVGAQTRQSLANVRAIVEAGGFAASDVVKLNTYLAEAADFPAMLEVRNEVLAEWFPDRAYAASTTVVAGMPPPGMIVEIEAIAARGGRDVVASERVPKAAGALYSEAVRAGDWVFLSGQVARGEDGAVVGRGDMKAQTAQTLRNLEELLESAGASFRDIAHVTVWVRSRGLYAPLNEVCRPLYEARFAGGGFPASTAVVGPSPLDEVLVEVEAVAYTGP